jgi:MYXO-CTERM domain-containing protein
VWGTLFTLLGYFIGQSIENVSGPVSLGLLGLIALVLLALHVRSRAKKRREEGREDTEAQPLTKDESAASPEPLGD